MGKPIITQKRGKGSNSYKAPSFKFKGEARVPNTQTEGVIVDFVHCPAHTAPLARVQYDAGYTSLMIAPEGSYVGQSVKVGTEEVSQGHTLELSSIPEGTIIYNVEAQPGDGGKFIRASGTFGKVGPIVQGKTTIIMPSKRRKMFNSKCRATIGVVAGGGRPDKPLLKAGNAHYKAKARNHLFPVVSGSAMNAVSHPFGNKRTARKSKNRPIPRNAPPGRKVGNVAARRTGQKKR